MKEFKDKVAVITGAASGIGRAMAERCVQEGMKVVLADVDVGIVGENRSKHESLGRDGAGCPDRCFPSQATSKRWPKRPLTPSGRSTCSATMPACRYGCVRLGKHHRGLGMGHRRQSMGRDSRRARLCPHHAGTRYGVPHRQHRLHGRTPFWSRVGSLQGDQAWCRHPLGNAPSRAGRARGKGQGLGALSGGCQHADHGVGAEPSWTPSERSPYVQQT